MICTAHTTECRWSNRASREEWDGLGMYHGWGRGVYRVLV